MYTHILIPTDGSELSNDAIRHGVALAKAVNAKVTGITVTTPFHVISMDPENSPIRRIPTRNALPR